VAWRFLIQVHLCQDKDARWACACRIQPSFELQHRHASGWD
jgi:hypothetical protein